MSIGWLKKWRIESATKEIIRGIIQEVEIILRNNPGLTLEESLKLVDKQRNLFFPDEKDIKTDLYSLFGMIVYKAYRCKRASDMDSCGQEHAKLVLQIAYDYLNEVTSKTNDDFEKLGYDASKYSNNTADIYISKVTGLMWPKNGNIAGVFMTWDNAMKWVAGLKYGGYSDWRLPTKDELKTFANQGEKRPSYWFNSNGFNNVQSSWYWSATADCTKYAGCVDMLDGITYTRDKNYDYYVWPVRSER